MASGCGLRPSVDRRQTGENLAVIARKMKQNMSTVLFGRLLLEGFRRQVV
jgi:hypothetical protein